MTDIAQARGRDQVLASRLRELLGSHGNEIGLAAVFVVMIAVLASSAPNFATLDNALNILRQASFVGVVAWGMTLVIISGEIDISPGAVAAFSGVALAELNSSAGLPLGVAALVVVLCGGLLGAGVGAMRAYIAVPTFIGSLALWSGLRGAGNVLTDGLPVPIANQAFQWLGNGALLGIPAPTVVAGVLFGVFWFVSRRTTFGRSAYAIGGNAHAAILNGVPVARTRVLLLATTGLLSATTGILIAAQLGAGAPSAATGMEFDVISAVVVGGTSLLGGRGSMLGTLLGVLFIATLINGLVLLGVNPFSQDVVRGVVILAAVVLNLLWRRNRE